MRSEDLDISELLLSWRLLAANNRDVARSATSYPDLASCLDALADLQARLDETVAAAARSGRADWSWRLRLEGRDVAMSSRTYQRRLQCEAACTLFIALVRDATLDVFDHPTAALSGRSSTPARVEEAPVTVKSSGTSRGSSRSDGSAPDAPVSESSADAVSPSDSTHAMDTAMDGQALVSPRVARKSPEPPTALTDKSHARP